MQLLGQYLSYCVFLIKFQILQLIKSYFFLQLFQSFLWWLSIYLWVNLLPKKITFKEKKKKKFFLGIVHETSWNTIDLLLFQLLWIWSWSTWWWPSSILPLRRSRSRRTPTPTSLRLSSTSSDQSEKSQEQSKFFSSNLYFIIRI